MTFAIDVRPGRVFGVLFVIILCLVAASTVAGAAWYFFDMGDSGFLFVQLFWLDSESNIPTLYSSLTLLMSAFLAGFIAMTRRRERARYGAHWTGLAAIFVYMALDEGAGIHERTVEPLRALLQLTPLPSSTFFELGPIWIIMGALLAVVVALCYVGFLLHLPPRIRNRLMLAGGIYLTGALAIEIVSHSHALVHGQETATYALLATLEEFLEMLGIAVFIYTLLLYIGSLTGRIEIKFARQA